MKKFFHEAKERALDVLSVLFLAGALVLGILVEGINNVLSHFGKKIDFPLEQAFTAYD